MRVKKQAMKVQKVTMIFEAGWNHTRIKSYTPVIAEI
jgi:hypothetical protein